MFGTIDIPEGGKLPPAPTFVGPDGKELESVWAQLPSREEGRTLYILGIPNAQDNLSTINGIWAWWQLLRLSGINCR